MEPVSEQELRSDRGIKFLPCAAAAQHLSIQ